MARRSESTLLNLDDDARVVFSSTLAVGRHPANDLLLDSPRVSSRHAVIEWAGDRWQIKDLGSSNGTSVNGRRVQGRRSIKTGDLIRFAGVSRWRVEALAPPPASATFGATEQATGPGPAAPVDLHLQFVRPGEGTIRVTGAGEPWQVTMAQRFVLLHRLGQAGGGWVDDHDLKIALWGRSGLTDIDPSALHRLIHDLRKLFRSRGVEGQIIEKARGRTRLSLPAERIHLTDD